MSKTDLVTIRDYLPSDRNFLFKTWLEGLRHGNEIFKKTNIYSFHKAYQSLIERLLAKPETTVKVAALKEDLDVIVGYAVTRPETIDWCFVKKGWRNLKIARDLVSHIEPKKVSNLTFPCGEAIRSRFNLKFEPFDNE